MLLGGLKGDCRIHLEPLQPADLTFLALDLLGVGSLPQEIADFLLRKSEGNPLYLSETWNFLKTSQLVRFVDVPPPPAGAGPAPPAADTAKAGGRRLPEEQGRRLRDVLGHI